MNTDTPYLMMCVLALTVGSIAIWTPQSAEACSPVPCFGEALIPEDGSSFAVLPEGQRLSFVWRPGANAGQMPQPSDVTLTHLGEDRTIDVNLQPTGNRWGRSWFIEPKESLEPQSNYRLEADGPCQRSREDTLTSTFQTTDRVFFPAPRANLDVRPLQRQSIQLPSGGSCSKQVPAATVSLDVQLGEQAQKWRDLLLYQTYVVDPSGERRRWGSQHSVASLPPLGGSWEGRGRDMLYTSCQDQGRHADFGLEAGVTYTVYVEMYLPGTNVSTRTEERRVTLRCDDTPEGDVGVDAGPGPTDTGPSIDVESPSSDTFVLSDATSPTTPDTSSTDSSDPSRSNDVHWGNSDDSAPDSAQQGASCTSTGMSTPFSWSWLFVLTGLIWTRRRFDE